MLFQSKKWTFHFKNGTILKLVFQNFFKTEIGWNWPLPVKRVSFVKSAFSDQRTFCQNLPDQLSKTQFSAYKWFQLFLSTSHWLKPLLCLQAPPCCFLHHPQNMGQTPHQNSWNCHLIFFKPLLKTYLCCNVYESLPSLIGQVSDELQLLLFH